MRIYLQMPQVDQHSPRFYHLHLQEDLLDGWSLVREWGFQGAGGRVQRDHFSDWESAQNAMLKLRDQQLQRGYRIVFVQGLENP